MQFTNRQLRVFTSTDINYKCTAGSNKIYKMYGDVLKNTLEASKQINNFEQLEAEIERLENN